MENAIVSYVKYIVKLVWPRDMAIYYPFPEAIPFWQVIAAIVFLSVITLLSVRLIKKAPYVIVGWLWYLGTLFPVIGISQHGRWPEMADRWMYVPEIGLLIIISWGGAALLSRFPRPGLVMASLGAVIIAALILSARTQAAYWQNSITLFEHALNVTEKTDLAHNNIGAELNRQGRMDEAIHHFLQALQINPNLEMAHNSLGIALDKLERTEEAITHYSQALRINPNLEMTHNSLGNALNKLGRTEEAIFHYLQAIRIDPNLEIAHTNLGNTLNRLGRTEEAIFHYRQSLAINPNDERVHYNLSVALYRKGDMTQAIKHLQTAVKLNPDYTPAKNLLKRLQNSQISK
ncbi:MAG: tetratricopeptide repeat protein [ANME-2 cluster archaeon]|nr:tetratricopeptide repeat protein [ANME-2 cluster archaeon]